MLYYWVQELGAIRSLQLGFNVHEPEKSTMKVPHAFRSNGGLKVVLTCPVPVHYVTPSQKRKKKVPTNKSEKKSTEKKLFSFDESDDDESAEEEESESDVAIERSTSSSLNSLDNSKSLRVDFNFDRIQHIIAIALQLLHFSRKFPSYLHIFTWEKDPRFKLQNEKNQTFVPPRYVSMYFQKYY